MQEIKDLVHNHVWLCIQTKQALPLWDKILCSGSRARNNHTEDIFVLEVSFWLCGYKRM